MKRIMILVSIFALNLQPVMAESPAVDSNIAYFAGELIDYVISAPSTCVMNQHEAVEDGYACVFLPADCDYRRSPFQIGVQFFRIRGMSFAEALQQDTANLRAHFGESLRLSTQASTPNASKRPVIRFTLSLEAQVSELREIAYFDGGSEMVVLELLVLNDSLAHRATLQFQETISRFRTTTRRELGEATSPAASPERE